MTFGARSHTSPVSPAARSAPVAGSTIRSSTHGNGRPALTQQMLARSAGIVVGRIELITPPVDSVSP